MEGNKTTMHCINVLKVFDWISKFTTIKLNKSFESQELVTDKICGIIDIPCGERELLWSVRGELSVSGSVTVCHEMGCEHIEIIVNRNTVFILSQGEEQTLDFNDLRSLEVRCIGNEIGFCIGRYCLTIHYKVYNGCFSPGHCQLTCFLSDKYGNPTETLECQEIIQKTGRRNVEVNLPNNKIVILQKVKVLKKGFITVQVLNKGKVCKLCIIPFKVVEEFILCAPSGTFIECKITEFECTAFFTDDCKRLDIEISFCQQVQVMANVTIEVEANLCVPRTEIDIHPCIEHAPHNMFKTS